VAGAVEARTTSRWGAAVLVAVAAMALLAIAVNRPGFFDNEGRYAEVAREMLLRRDFVTPTMDFTLFLNKPPLVYWIAAAGFSLFGLSEWVRVFPLAIAGLTVIATARLGARLWDESTGLLAAALLAVTLGFAQEARVLRPDMLLVLSVVCALDCWLAAMGDARRRTAWLVAFYAVLGMGVLAKGLVPVVVAGIPIGLLTLRDHGWRGVARLRPLLGLVVFGAVVLPWHVAVALEHPGFAWDYVVNQHLLFFLDKKFPRDSEGDTLLTFWSVFAARAFPWIVLLPFTLAEARRGLAPWPPPAAGAPRPGGGGGGGGGGGV